MKIGILGTGMVGKNIGRKLAELGHEVMMGSRTSNNQSAIEWASQNGPKAAHGTFEDAAKFGGMLFLCVKGDAAKEAIEKAGIGNFKGKIVVDITNPLSFQEGREPLLFVSNTSSLSEDVQKTIPDALVVKTLNMVSSSVMTDPKKAVGEASMFISGNDSEAKAKVKKVLQDFGWKDVLDLGDIKAARGMEMLLPIWLRLWGTLQDGDFAFKIARKTH